jgi:hypothetical protein
MEGGMTSSEERIRQMPLKADGAYVRGARDGYHVATISSGMNDREQYASLFAASPILLDMLRTLSDGVSDMRKRGVIDEERDAQWLDETLAQARILIGTAT